jgi:hypothetical protein
MANPFARSSNPKRIRIDRHADGRECDVMACHDDLCLRTITVKDSASVKITVTVCSYHEDKIRAGLPVVGA